jgi:hypothetical protein
MKIDLTSLFFNCNIENGVGTPSWGTALGQKEGYDITVEGASDILLGMHNNRVDPSGFEANFKSVNDISLISEFKNVYVDGHRIAHSFLLALVVEHSTSHDGRKSLKYNDKFKCTTNGKTISNEDFYNEVQEYFGPTACWFAHEINVINGKELHIKAVKVSDEKVTYYDSKERKKEWTKILNPEIIHTPFVKIKNSTISQFVFDVLKYLNNSKEIQKLFPFIKLNKDNRFYSIEKDEYKLTSIFWVFSHTPTSAEISSGGIVRIFEEHSFEYQGNNFFLSKQWADQKGHRLDINTFIRLFNSIYKNYKISREGTNYEFNRVNELTLIVEEFRQSCNLSGLIFSQTLITRFISAAITKPFIILSGLSGSGKTKLAQTFASWLCEDESQYCLIPVGADWTNREPLLGFPNALDKNKYVKPENGALDLIIRASENQNKPFFLILDEMNLSHVERYFADFLSTMESGGKIFLHDRNDNCDGLPAFLTLPKNLFIIGTVNIDETTYMFSPKVLDRANTIEFRITKDEMSEFLSNHMKLNLGHIIGGGKRFGKDFLEIAISNTDEVIEIKDINSALDNFFVQLQNAGAEFGYRTASEIQRFTNIVPLLSPKISTDEIVDYAILQKLLPKIHGSRRKLEPILEELMRLCLNKDVDIKDYKNLNPHRETPDDNVKYPLSLEKVVRMYISLVQNGYVSFAEA